MLAVTLTHCSDVDDVALSSVDGGSLIGDSSVPDASAPDAGRADVGFADSGTPAAEPITATDGMWTWVDFPGAKCGAGTSTGIGVNLSSASPNVFIFLEGGGACWDEQTCYQLQLATNLDGFGREDFDALASSLSVSYWDRDDAENPLRDWSFVYIPYCTGDVHSGSNVANHGEQETHHVGHVNILEYLNRLTATFDAPDRVVLAGASAGGYGAAFNYAWVQDAFPTARVDLIDDSGPVVVVEPNLEMLWTTAWDFPDNYPEGCTECGGSLTDALTFAVERAPNARSALFSYGRDGVIAFFLRYTPAGLEQALFELKTSAYDPYANARVFFISGRRHTMLRNPREPVQNGQSAWQWLNAMLADDPTWTDVTF